MFASCGKGGTFFASFAYDIGMQKTISVVDLSAIRANALKIRDGLDGRFFFAVVKAEAYGHGAIEVAREIEDVADGFCVAVTDEGVKLRVGGISKPVLVLAPPLDGEDVEICRHYRLTVTVNGVRTARLVGNLPCHVKINTGMNRYGCSPDETERVLAELDAEQVEGVYTHLYAADKRDESLRQLDLFAPAERAVKQFAPRAFAHVSASGGFLRGGEFLKDGVRCGILLYGYAPAGFSRDGFSPALKVYARCAQRSEALGGGIGYHVAEKKYGRLSTYRLGYADGFARTVALGEKALCMDAFVREENAAVCQSLACGGVVYDGMRPVFFDADEYAGRCGTISYEALCSVTRRSRVIYVK